MNTNLPRALVSIHDLMPETLAPVARILALLDSEGVSPVTLLVVPGRDWSASQIAQLRTWQDAGHRLAGHGWQHRTEGYGGLAHRLHALLISRDVAEHLALDEPSIGALISRCHDWFGAHELNAPTLFVPPAWALGSIARTRLAELPFRHYELFASVLDGPSGQRQRVALLGYEADGALRAPVLRLWNRYNRYLAKRLGWIRIGIHPHDLDLPLAAELCADLRRYRHYADYEALEPAPGSAARSHASISVNSPRAATSIRSNTCSKPR